ncbi:MAG: LysE family transporter [Crenarchaeota archaeon]|nr:LysE family transporter [Thermoproteota archaeon]
MLLVNLVITIIVLSVSGACAPGPLTFAALIVGSWHGAKGGFKVAVGHMMFEAPYVFSLLLLFNSIRSIFEIFTVRLVLALIACFFIIYFSYLGYLSGVKIVKEGHNNVRVEDIVGERVGKYLAKPIIVGLLLTGLNPWFLIWWITVGGIILVKALSLGLIEAFIVVMGAHVWLDYVWLTLMAYLSSKGLKVLGRRYGYILQALSIILAVFGVLLVVKLFLT